MSNDTAFLEDVIRGLAVRLHHLERLLGVDDFSPPKLKGAVAVGDSKYDASQFLPSDERLVRVTVPHGDSYSDIPARCMFRGSKRFWVHQSGATLEYTVRHWYDPKCTVVGDGDE